MGHDPDESDFEEFLKQVVDSGDLDETQAGVTRQVIAKGRDSLSAQQDGVFRAVLDDHTLEGCSRCTNPIPWSEMFLAVHLYDGMCSYCSHMVSKNADD